MKSIALIELQEHQEVLFGLIDQLRLNQVELKVFAPAYMLEELEADWREDLSLKMYGKQAKESIPEFIQRHKDQIDACDLAIFTTLITDFAFFARLKFKARTILLIHKGNFFFAYQQNLQLRSLKDVLRWVRSVWQREDFYKQKMLQNFTHCAFLDPLIQEHQQPHLPKGVSFLPAFRFSYYTPMSALNHQPLRVLIPGTVSNLTRDFETLFVALAKADAHFQTEIELIFLGNAGTNRAKGLFNLMAQFPLKQVHIVAFDQVLTHSEYTSQLQQADFFVLPLRAMTYFGIVREQYGQTTISGGINDMLRFGKPTLLPDFYPLDPALDALTRRYTNADELATLLIQWVNTAVYLEIGRAAQPQLEQLEQEPQRMKLWEIINSQLHSA